MSDIYVGQSRIAGTGVFASRAFKKGERILTFDDSRIITAVAPLRPDLGEIEEHVDHLQGGAMVYMKEPERYINHCCDPTMFCRYFEGVRYAVARRDLAAHEEITSDYCVNSAVTGVEWSCECGAARCRRRGCLDYFSLPRWLQLEYLPLLDRWFVDDYRDRLLALFPDFRFDPAAPF